MRYYSVLGQVMIAVMTAVRLYCYGKDLQHCGLLLPFQGLLLEHFAMLSTKHRLGIRCPCRSPTDFRIILLNCGIAT